MTQHPTIDAIKRAVAEAFEVPLDVMTAETRRIEAAHPRQAAMALAIKLTGRNSTVIARHFGGRDHTTVLHARKAVARRRVRDAELDRRLRRLETRFTAAVPEPLELQLAFLDGPLFDLIGVAAHG